MFVHESDRPIDLLISEPKNDVRIIPAKNKRKKAGCNVFTVVPEKLRKWAGTFCVLLPHGRDE